MGMYDTVHWIGHAWQTKDLQDPLLQTFRIEDDGTLARREGYYVHEDGGMRFREVGWLTADHVHGPVSLCRIDHTTTPPTWVEYCLTFAHGQLITATLIAAHPF